MSHTDVRAQMRCKSNQTRLAGVALLGRIWILTALGLMPSVVNAVTIAPVIVELSPARKVVSITVTNPSGNGMKFQAEFLAWDQANGQDHYVDTDDLMVVPPIADIPAGGSQIFRITRRTAPSPREQAYRLILEDVTEETSAAADVARVSIRVRHSLPVFVTLPGKPRMHAYVSPCAAPKGKACVRLNNDGDHYLMAKGLVIQGGAWQQKVALGTRVLAGAWREWLVALPAKTAGPFRVQVDTTAGQIAGEITALPH